MKVFTTGTFDILHYGHISLLRRAKALGDYLIVGVNVNPEGKTPFYSFQERKEILMSIKYVDEVVPLYKQEDKFNFLKYVDIFACGAEYKNYFDIPQIEKSVKVVFLDRTPGISTTQEKEQLPPKELYNTICIDIDDTLSYTYNRDFENSVPNQPMIDKVNVFHNAGYKVILATARGAKSCRTVEERIEKYDAVTRQWLEKHHVLYDELWFGKPNADFYIDDKSMYINEFLDFKVENKMPIEEIAAEKIIIPENNDTIDIIVPWVDENDSEWRKLYNKWKDIEIAQGIQKSDNLQAFGKERIRDWNVFQYWFRGVEKNCPWVNKVFLVIQSESQIPTWLNRDNPKLRIVYHDEFIPKELLPTFSTLVIETFYYRIPDLSNHFIVCNDDFYFLNPIPKDLFFKDGKCHYGCTGTRSSSWSNGNKVWSAIVNNNSRFLGKNIVKTNNFIHYSHLPDGRVKEFEANFMAKYFGEIYSAMNVSKFRHPKNLIPSLLFIDSMKYKKYSVKDDRVYKNSCYKTLGSYMDWNTIKKKQMVCLNDTVTANSNFEKIKASLINFFEGLFPEKSSFEK